MSHHHESDVSTLKSENISYFVESQQSKSNFLAKFSKHQIEKQDEVILLEVETALPVVSHVMQQSDSEILWYKNLLVSVSLRKFTIIKERKDCMVVPSNVSLKSLINLDLVSDCYMFLCEWI